jgi:hypothetical protein
MATDIHIRQNFRWFFEKTPIDIDLFPALREALAGRIFLSPTGDLRTGREKVAVLNS